MKVASNRQYGLPEALSIENVAPRIGVAKPRNRGPPKRSALRMLRGRQPEND